MWRWPAKHLIVAKALEAGGVKDVATRNLDRAQQRLAAIRQQKELTLLASEQPDVDEPDASAGIRFSAVQPK